MVKITRHKDLDQKNIQGTPQPDQEGITKKLGDQVQLLSDYINKIGIHEYMVLCRNPRRIITVNLIAGLFRGVGVAIGFTLLTALVLFVLNRLAILNLPFFGDIIVELLRYVDNTRGIRL